MDREAALHLVKDRHRYRPYVIPYLKLASGKVSVNTIKNKKRYLQSGLPASNCTKKEEGAHDTHSVLYSLSSFT